MRSKGRSRSQEGYKKVGWWQWLSASCGKYSSYGSLAFLKIEDDIQAKKGQERSTVAKKARRNAKPSISRGRKVTAIHGAR
jgi:hypothetical protein